MKNVANSVNYESKNYEELVLPEDHMGRYSSP